MIPTLTNAKKPHFSQIGWYSEDEGLHLSLNVERLNEEIDNYADPVSSPLINNDRSLHGRSFEQQEGASNNIDLVTTIVAVTTSIEEDPYRATEDRKNPIFSYEAFISRTWTLVVLAVTIFGTCVALWMFIYVLIKMCDGTLTGNQTMGLILLMGVTSLFASVVPWLLPPNPMICTVRHFLHPIVMVLCFAILLVKAMQLRSLVSVGLGGTIPQINQIVSLIFMVLVQVVIAGEWYAASQPLGVVFNQGYPECDVSRKRFLLLHLYPCTLLLLAFFYGMTVLKIKRNFNEGRWITCATAFIIPVFVAWSLVYYFAPVQFHDPSVAVSIVAVAGILLSAIFVPKMHTIAHQSRLKNLDLYRSHSDSTVFTGFSDFVTPAFPPSKKHQKYYPIYGYNTNYPTILPPYNPIQRLRPPPFITSLSPHPRLDFNGLNYVSTHQRRGPRLTSFNDWAHQPPGQSESSRRGRPRRRHSSSPKRDEVIHSSPRSKSSSKDEARRGRSRNKRSSNNATKSAAASNAQPQVPHTNPKHYLRIHTTTSSNTTNNRHIPPHMTSKEAMVEAMREVHSRSPSDGMILTASGLRDTMSSEKFNNSNVVIVDGGLNNRNHEDLHDDSVYLTTS